MGNNAVNMVDLHVGPFSNFAAGRTNEIETTGIAVRSHDES